VPTAQKSMIVHDEEKLPPLPAPQNPGIGVIVCVALQLGESTPPAIPLHLQFHGPLSGPFIMVGFPIVHNGVISHDVGKF
jgi:hypothetical protein